MHIGNLVQLMTLRRLQQAAIAPLRWARTTKGGRPPSGKEKRADPVARTDR